ncbi:PaaI family thioesterase [Cryptosporangium minutisporangium]|uniref:PaaI family thioesterase n=1 Tax=Cryptosporangium minutisporangium TaxID=113569 RepID=A0ABP6T200_9ACTN
MTPFAWAAKALEDVPANALIGLRVRTIDPNGAEVELPDDARLRNPYGAVQAGPLLGLLDAAALGAVLGHLTEDHLATVTTVARSVSLDFLAPARGVLTGTSSLTVEQRAKLRALVDGDGRKLALETTAEARAADGTVVSRATFSWVLRR